MKRSKLIQAAFESGLIAPSILSADFSCLADEIKSVEKEGVRWIHVDVMDGHFVPNLTIGPVVVESIRPKSKSILDCHLMVSQPHQWVDAFAAAGADCITVHAEVGKDMRPLLKKIRALKCMAGISINPATPVSAIQNLLDHVDLVLVMSVNPGFGGQKFMENALAKIETLVELRGARKFLVEVDGGIHSKNIAAVRSAGADVMVAGSAVFGAKNRKKSLGELKKAMDRAN
jgi:ribulose-phosphate 3-epimerase